MTHHSKTFTVVACMLMAATVVVVVVVTRYAASQTTREDRFGMTEVEFEQFKKEAERMGLTPAGLKAFIGRELGRPLLYDKKRKVVVSYHADPDGAPTRILITPDPLGTENVSIDYRLSSDSEASTVIYAGALPETGDRRSAMWRDLNADGIFDQLFVTTDHNELLNLDRGGYILLDGKWAAAQRDEAMPKGEWKVGAISYAFDAKQGRWLARDAQ